MTIHLTPYGEQLLQEQLASGPYWSPEEVIEHALEVLAKKEPGALAKTNKDLKVERELEPLPVLEGYVPKLTQDDIY